PDLRKARVDDRERVVARRHEHAPHQVHDGDADAGRALSMVNPRAGSARRVVERAEQARLAREVLEDLRLVPDVVAARQAVEARGEKLLRAVGRDTEAVGRVLDIGPGEVDAATGTEP